MDELTKALIDMANAIKEKVEACEEEDISELADKGIHFKFIHRTGRKNVAGYRDPYSYTSIEFGTKRENE
jgi:hypothetical protein